MARTVEYWVSPASPWSWLGHARFGAIAARQGVEVNIRPVDFGIIFPQSGGLPLARRAPQRQAYRLVELARWRDFLGIPLVLQPKHLPVDAGDASRLVCGAPAGQRFALLGGLMSAFWAEDRDLADAAVLAEVAARHGVADAAAAIAAGRDAYEANTQMALARGVFGAPTYDLDGELFWGQDRLEFLARALAR